MLTTKRPAGARDRLYFPALELARAWNAMAGKLGWRPVAEGLVLPPTWFRNGVEYARREGAEERAPEEFKALVALLEEVRR
jgi:hypothetical protein